MREPKPHKPVIVRYVGPDGRRCRKSTPGAVKHVEEADTYYVWLGKGKDRHRYSLETTDLGQAWIELRRLQKKLADRTRGITDDYSDHADRPLLEHVEEWLQTVLDSGTTQDQVDLMRSRVLKLAGMANWKRITDIDSDECLAALAKLQRDEWTQPKVTRKNAAAGKGKRPGRSAQTRNHYLRHIKQLTNWLVPKRLRADPLHGLKALSVDADRRHDRRAPSDDEVLRLMVYLASESAKVYRGMSGPQRALGYKVAMATGLRAKELRSLTREAFNLDAGEVTVRAAYDKAGRPVNQQLPPWLVDELRAWFAAAGDVWGRFPRKHPGQVLQLDLEAAGVPYETAGPDGPLFFDFHALRHWYVTAVANQPGLSLKTLLTLTRHSTPELALKVYAKARRQDTRDAVDRLPHIAPPAPPFPPANPPPPTA